MPTITPSLWFDTQSVEAAEFYVSIFPNSKITNVAHYGEAGPREAGTVLTVEFELDGQPYTAINGGPQFTFDEAISLHDRAATARTRSTTTGASSPTAARKAPAAGSRTATGSPGRSCRPAPWQS